MSYEVEIGRGKRGRRAYSLDDIALIPARRTRDPEDVNVSWQLDAYHLDIPVLAAPMDSVMSPSTAVEIGRLGGVGVLDLDGLWTRYEDPLPLLEEIVRAPDSDITSRLQQIYSAPIRDELIGQRLEEMRVAGVTVAGRLSPQRTQRHWRTAVEAGIELFVIRGSTVSAEHVSSRSEPLNLKRFIYELDVPVVVGGVATYTAAEWAVSPRQLSASESPAVERPASGSVAAPVDAPTPIDVDAAYEATLRKHVDKHTDGVHRLALEVQRIERHMRILHELQADQDGRLELVRQP